MEGEKCERGREWRVRSVKEGGSGGEGGGRRWKEVEGGGEGGKT